MAAEMIDLHNVFQEAVARTSDEERRRFLDEACGQDAHARARVEALLRAHSEAGGFFGGKSASPAITEIPSSSEMVGMVIGPYKLLEQIGEGGMGLVYMAEQQQPVRRLVALKIIKPGMDSKQVIARFEAERQALAMMDHPNIAKVHDAGTTEKGRPYFVMELVRGLPINEFCDQKRLAVRDRLQLFVQVCQAVQHAHQKGIIHRDLKPTNVLVTMADTVAFPKLLDFGIAKALGQSLTDNTLHTGYSQLVGTPLYMSPEQAEMNLFGVDTRSDVYSLGVLLYELLTGTTPFDKETLANAGLDEMRRIIREEEPETVSARIAKTRRVGPARAASAGPPNEPRINERRWAGAAIVPPYAELDWIVMKALEKDRSRRYESASALAADIQRYLSDEPVLACPPTTMYRFQKFARKHQPALATAVAIALCLILGTTVSAWQAVRATTAEAQATVNEQKAVANEAQAKQAAAAEAQQRQRAEANEQQADAQRDEVKALYDKLAAKEQQLQRTLYTAHMNLARHAWDAGATDQMVELLTQHRPKPGESDLRGFEWHYLYRLCHGELLALKEHAGGVNRVAYSPDGKLLAAGTGGVFPNFNGEVKVWDTQTGQELLTLKGHNGWIWSLAFSSDGKRLASGSGGGLDHRQQKGFLGEVKVWDMQTGQELLTIQGKSQLFPEVTFSPDGKRLAIASGPSWEQGEVKLWDSQTGQELLTLKGHTGYIASVAFNPDGNRLASAAVDATVKVWDAQTGEELLSIKDWANNAVFSPDGKRLAGASDRSVKVWDAEAGRELLACKGHARNIRWVAYSPDGKRLASGSDDRAVKVWDAESGEEILTFKGHTAQVNSVAFSPDGKHVASGSDDGTVKIWDAAANVDDRTVRGPSDNVTAMAYSPDGTHMATLSGESTLKVWNAQTGQELLSLQRPTVGRGSRSGVVAYSPDGKRLASSSGQEVKVCDAQTGQELLTFKGHNGLVWSIAYSPDGKRLASSSAGNVVKVWDAQTGQELLSLPLKPLVNKNGPTKVTFSPDGKRLATLSTDIMIRVWDAQTGQELLSFSGHPGPILCMAFSPDSRHLVSGGRRGSVKVWEAESGQEVLGLSGHTDDVIAVAYSPDGKRLATRTGDNAVKVWDAQTGQETLSAKGIAPERGVVGRAGRGDMTFSPDGHRLVCAGANNRLEIYDAMPLPEMP